MFTSIEPAIAAEAEYRRERAHQDWASSRKRPSGRNGRRGLRAGSGTAH